MAPATTSASLSPAELSYLHTSLSQTPPIRPDGRSPTQFRPLTAETDILPSTNGSARICFADGTEAVVGIKAEVEKSSSPHGRDYAGETEEDATIDVDMDTTTTTTTTTTANDDGRKGRDAWVEVQIEMPGYRDDDALPVFLGAMLRETLIATDALKDGLYINRRFHWRLYIDVRTFLLLPFFHQLAPSTFTLLSPTGSFRFYSLFAN
jgi:exosome complex component RRP42